MHDRPDLPDLLEAFKKKDLVIKEFESAKQNLKKAKSLLQMAELNKMKRVLRRMKYCDQVAKKSTMGLPRALSLTTPTN